MSEKTEKATSKKRQDERKKGNIFQSKDITTVASLTVAFYVLKAWMPNIYRFLSDAYREYFGLAATTLEIEEKFVVHLFTNVAITFVSIISILVIAIIISSILISGAQTRFHVSSESLKFKFSKINPLTGIKKLFSLRSFIELLKNIIKIIIIGSVVYSVIIKNMQFIPKLMYLDILSAVKMAFDVIMDVVNSVIIYFLAISIVDFIYQWWEYEKNIKMTKQEVKDEFKNTEGNPEIKGKIRQIQRTIATSRMMQQVPSADVIIRNPTHFAVAIKYDEKSNRAPFVVAKGQDRVALNIIKLAEESKVLIMENKPLARALYSSVELNQEVPVEFYEPIAEILAWVYNINNKDLKNIK
jgi:flagellar biosynthetic protein FlhB